MPNWDTIGTICRTAQPPQTFGSTPWLSGPVTPVLARNLEPARIHSSAAGQRHLCWGYPSTRRRRLPVETKEAKQQSQHCSCACATQRSSSPVLYLFTSLRYHPRKAISRQLGHARLLSLVGTFPHPFPLFALPSQFFPMPTAFSRDQVASSFLLEDIRRMIPQVRPVLCSGELMGLFQLASDLDCPAF